MLIRTATADDISLIFSFIQKKAEFDRSIGAFSGVLQVSPEKIHKTLFGTIPFAHVLLAETLEHPIGFALYEFRYSSFAGQPSIWLDDLYVDEKMRSQGAGSFLMYYLAEIAKENDCTHLAWTADARNTRGLSFYHRLGAEIIEQKDYRCFLRWNPLVYANLPHATEDLIMDTREVIEIFVEKLWNQRQLELADDLFPADFVAEPIAYQPLWQGTGPDSMKHHIQEWLEGVPDLQMKAIATIVQDDQVWMRWEMTGTHSGVLYGVSPTGQSIKALGVTLFAIEDNQIRTLETIFDGLGLMQQLGVLPDAGTLISNHLNHLASSA